MKKIGKALLMVSLVSSFTFSATMVSLAGTWEQQANGRWKYLNDDGSYVTSCLIDGYYLNSDGIWLEDIKSDNGTNGSWKNEEVAKQIGSEIQNKEGFSQNPIRIENHSATFGHPTWVMKISKTDDGYDLTLKTRIKSDSGKKALRALTYLICDDDTLYDAIYNSFEGDETLYGINYDNFVPVGNYQIKATLEEYGKSFIYTIKEN